MKKIIVVGSGKLISTVEDALVRINEEAQIINLDNGIANGETIHLTESECTEITAFADTLKVNQTIENVEISLLGISEGFTIDPKKIQKEQSQQGWKHRNKYKR